MASTTTSSARTRSSRRRSGTASRTGRGGTAGNGGLASNAIAAIDIAVWDLKGKALGRSVCDLLGGPVHERLPAIASSHAHFESIPEMVEEAQGWLDDGLHGVKVGFGKRGNARLGYEHDRDVDYVRAMREGLGADKQLIIDLGIAIKWDVATAVKRVQAFDDYDITWIEEPLGAWDPEGYATLRQDEDAASPTARRSGTSRGSKRCWRPGPVMSSAATPVGGGHHRLQEGHRPRRGLPPPGQRPRLVVGDRHRRQPGDLVLVDRLQGVRGQATAQPDAARLVAEPFGTEAVFVHPRLVRDWASRSSSPSIDRYRQRPAR